MSGEKSPGKYLLFENDGPFVWREQELLQKVIQPVTNLEKTKEANVVLP